MNTDVYLLFFSLSLIWLMILYINLHVDRLIPVTLTFWRSKLYYFTPLHVYVMFLHDRYIVNKPPKNYTENSWISKTK